MKNFFNNFHTNLIYSTANKFRRFIKLGKDKCKTGENTNALHTHISDTNHNINFNKVKILDRESRLECRLPSEMFYIHLQNKFVNKMTDTMNLNEDYKAFIHKIKN